jgi:WD40 repeat protein/tRNA A-37 threonylcarbamoyl transferase component Bud32
VSEIPTADWSWIDAAAQRFERAWKKGLRPRIEDYLAEADESRRPPLLEELLRVECELRRRAGEMPGREEYAPRFPEQAAVIDAIFAAGPMPSDVTGPLAASTTAAPVTTDGQTDGDPSPAPGTRVRYFGDYELIREIGRGGMGVVYKARQISLNRPVALKMIRAAALASEDEVRRFRNEAESVAKLDHPHIVPVYEVGEHDGRHYFTMKLIAGPSVQETLSPFAADPKAVARLMVTVAEAVHHAHQRGILHRDLKPSNILLDELGRPHVTDFGLAKRVEADEGLTLSGAVVGTPAYMAPEQAWGKRRLVTTLSDVYGLGAVLYALLTGVAPFGGETALETLDRVRREPPVPPTRVNPRVPRDVEVICLTCLAKEPAERYPTAGALAADLGRFIAGEPVSVRAPGVIERAAKWAWRKPTLAAAYTLGLLAVLFGGLGGAAVWQWRAAERARVSADSARREAVAAQDAERKAREQLAVVEYGRTIEVAHQKWRENKITAARSLLDGTRADLRGWEWQYVDRLCHSELLDLKAHTDIVFSAFFSPDGSRIVTASWDKTAKVWDARSGAELLTLKGHSRGVWSASFSPDGSRIVTGSLDKTAKVWDAKTGVVLLTLRVQTVDFACASFSPDGSQIVTVTGDATAKVWDAKTGAEVLTLKGQSGAVTSASFSPDGSRIVTGSGDATAKVWDARTGAEVLTLRGHTQSLNAASFSPDGSRILTASQDAIAKVWDARTGAEVLTLRGHTDNVWWASFSPDGSRVVTGSADNTARVWDARSGAEVLTLEGHNSVVASASFSPDGSRIVTASWDKTAKVWCARSGAEVLTLKGHTARVVSAWFSPDGSRVVTGSWDGTAKVWDAHSGAEILTLGGHTVKVASGSFSPDGSRVVTGNWDATATVWDARTGTELLTLKGQSGTVSSASFSPDGSRIVTGYRDSETAKVWDAKTGAELLTLKGQATGFVSSASFSPDGSRIMTGGSPDGTAKVWDARSGAEVLAIKGHTSVSASAPFSPDGSRVLTCDSDEAKVWDAKTGAELLTLRAHLYGVNSASFSPDGSRVVTCGNDGTAKVWDAGPFQPRELAERPQAVR